MRRLALVGLEWIRAKDPTVSVGIASISASLTKHGVDHEVHTTNVKEGFDESLIGVLLDSACTDVCIGAFVWNEPYVKRIIEEVSPYKRVILGGPQVSYLGKGEMELHYPNVHGFIRGDGEDALVAYGKSGRGVHVAGSRDVEAQAVCLNPPSALETIGRNDFMRWESQRGCAYQCSFCQHRNPTGGVRRFGNRVQKDLQWLAENSVSDIAVLDPIFNSNTLHACSILNSIHKCKLSLQIRPEKLNPTFLKAACDSDATVTLEMGVQSLVAKEMKVIDRIKGACPEKSLQKVKSKLLLAEQYDLASEISLIYGLPFQTLDSFMRTYEWCKENTSAKILAFPLMLLRGTPIYYSNYGLREGFLECDRQSEFIPHVIETPTMSTEDICHIRDFVSIN